jgi:hypothetical protein
VGGKLYILGGAWNVVQRPADVTSLNVTVAIKLSVPWDLANHRLGVMVRLLTSDGELVELSEGPVEAGGELEVARGLGLRQGTPLVSTFVLPFGLSGVEAGSYVFELRVRDQIIATEPFQVQ